MDSSNNFFLNTNQNAQLNQLPLQPFAPTPNPRSRFPQHQIPQTGGASSLTVPKTDSFYITVSPPADQNLIPPFTNTLGAENPFLLPQHQTLSSKPSSTNSLAGSLNSQPSPTSHDFQSTLSPGRFISPGMEQKGLYRKKGYSVGNQSQPNCESFEQERKFSYDKSNPDYYSESKATLNVPGRRSFGPQQNEKGSTSTQAPNSMELLQIPGNSWKSLGSMSDDKDNVEDVMIMIEEHQINTVSMLNEVSSKIKKRIEYSMNETPHGKNRVFECVCLMEKAKIGTGKGNSKQAAKTEAAKTAISTLISKSVYASEGQAVMMSIKKAAGQPGSHSPSISGKTNSKLDRSSEQIISDRDDSVGDSFDTDNTASLNVPFTGSGNAHMNDSPLYELNVIAKECFIEPKWTLSPQPNEETGEFEVELRFDKLVACGKGKKKQDAKRDAAIKIIKQIRSSSELTERFNPKSKKLSKASSFMTETGMNDKEKRFFDEALNYSFFEDIHRKNYSLKDAMKKTNQDLEALLISIGERQKFDTSTTDTFRDLFKKVQDYTSMITSATKQIMIDAPKHVADFIGNCYLIPIGSFALGCLRKDKPVADCIMMFHEVKEIKDNDFLELYKQALEECQSLDDRNSGYHSYKIRCKFAVKSDSSQQHYLEVINLNENEHFKINIHIFNLTQQLKLSKEKLATQKYENWIIHVKRIYDSLEHLVDELPNFRTLLIALRIWREKNNIISLPTQILDIVLLSEFLNTNPINIASIITNCLTILSSEDSLRNTLSRFGEFYRGLYEEISQESKAKVHEVSSQSLSGIFIGELSSAKFF